MPKHPDAGELADEFGMTIHYGREDKVAEHVHKWAFSSNVYMQHSSWTVAVIKCKACGLERGPEWMERRLNATERLSAEDAREISSEVHSAWWPLEGTSPYEDGLNAYAAALGKDE